MHQSAVEYERVARDLASADIEASASEVHGLLCGLLCAGKREAYNLWFGEVFKESEPGDLLVAECSNTLERLYNETREAIDGPGLGFTSLLPDDQSSIRDRAAAVCDWSQGFLYGIGLSGISADRELSEHTREALNDFSDIVQLDIDALDDGVEHEDDLMQVTEFLWVAAMMVHDDLVPDPTARS